MRNRQASVVFVLITLFIDILGMGLVIPILPRLVQSMLGGAISDASFVFGLLVSVYALMQFFCAPILGALSDRFGRRPIILLALLGLGFDYVLLSVAPSIWWKKLSPDGANANAVTSQALTDLGRAATFYDCLVEAVDRDERNIGDHAGHRMPRRPADASFKLLDWSRGPGGRWCPSGPARRA